MNQKEAMIPNRTLLVHMPWANLGLPNLALGLFKSILTKAGEGCDVLYANLISEPWLGGWQRYDVLAVEMASELVFSPLYFQTDRRDAAEALAEEFRSSTVVPREGPAFYLNLINQAEIFLDHLLQTVQWDRYDVVGFSLTFQQTLPALSLSRRLKRFHPHLGVLFGGASCDGDMGPEMIRSFPEIDYIVVGEADGVILDVIRDIRRRRIEPQAVVATKGVGYRNSAGETVFNGPAPLSMDLDSLPDPDLSEYFETVPRDQGDGRRPRIYLEHSRGCWYGEHRACKFCGLSEMTFRRKSPERALQEMIASARRYGVVDFYMSDNILDHRYYDTLLPNLARLRHEEGLDLTLFYELKSNLRRWQVEMLAAAGVIMVQIGIESFDDEILRLMSKGVSAIQQIQSLKHLEEFGIKAVWNILYRNPMETPESFLRMADTIGYLHHLPPPEKGQVGPMVLQRFSQYWRDPGSHGIHDIRPLPIYAKIYPDSYAGIDLDRLACFFEYRHDTLDTEELDEARMVFFDAVNQWRSSYRNDALTYSAGPDWVKVIDRRNDRSSATAFTLTGLQAEIFLYCDSARHISKALRHFQGRVDGNQLRQFLDLLVERKLMFRSHDNRYLSLPLHVRK